MLSPSNEGFPTAADIFYHTHPVLLRPGDVIPPGNYGRLIQERGITHPLWKREEVLEAVRQLHFSSLPSRLRSCFFFNDLNVARFYQDHLTNGDILYEVELLEARAIRHKGDFNCVQPMPRCDKTMEEIAHIYWTGKHFVRLADRQDLTCMELLAETPIRIIKELTRPPH